MTPGAMTPREIDTVLADLWGKESALLNEIARLTEFLARTDKTRASSYQERNAARLPVVKAEAAALRNQSEPLEAEYRRRPWKRYFLVTNGNGHVHRGTSCTTCFPTTQYGWLTALSDCDEKVMVAEYGEQACTVCFPDAPSMYALLGGKARIERDRDERKVARDAKRAEAHFKRVAKAITNPDGSVLKGRDWRIDTVSAAWRELTDLTETIEEKRYAEGSYVAAHIEEYREARARITAALAHKTGRSADEITAEAAKKVQRRGRS